MTAGYIGNRHSRLGRFLHKRHLLLCCVPPAALDPGKHFDSISIVRHSRKTRRTPSSYLMRLCPVQMGAAPYRCSGARGLALRIQNYVLPLPFSSLWSGWQGLAAHPSSPAGGGGPGAFASPGSLNGNASAGSRLGTPSHPGAPSAKFLTPIVHHTMLAMGQPGQQSANKANPPPATVPGTSPVKSGEQEVTLEILADAHVHTLKDDEGKDRTDIAETVPAYSWSGGPDGIKITVTIQTTYASDAKATDISGYGRGTTSSDIAAGDITLGFHESCHREDFTERLKQVPVPIQPGWQEALQPSD